LRTELASTSRYHLSTAIVSVVIAFINVLEANSRDLVWNTLLFIDRDLLCGGILVDSDGIDDFTLSYRGIRA
jgi:hypothetical protein